MKDIIDTMFLKRFCLPSNTDISQSIPSSCLCGNYNHASCILQGKSKFYEKG